MKLAMTMLNILILVNLLSGDPLTFQKTYGGKFEDFGRFVQENPEGGYDLLVIGESFTSKNNPNLFFIQLDAAGEIKNTKYTPGRDYVQAAGDGYVFFQTYKQFNTSMVRLSRLDKNFALVWEKNFQADWGYSACETADKGYIVLVGHDYEVYLQKLDKTGALLWERTFGGIYGLGHYYVEETSDSGYIVVGDRENNENSYPEILLNLIKFDAAGNEIWHKEFAPGISALCVEETIDGGYIMTGSKESNSFTGRLSLLLMKTDSSGELEWTKEFKSESHQEGIYVRQTADGGYIVTGRTGAAANKDIIVIKTNSLGEVGE